MNGPGDIPLTHSSTPDTKACSLISIIPTLGMSSCRGRAEAFARSLSSKLRTLGPQTEGDVISPEDEPIINGGNSTNTWRTNNDSDHTVTDLQPLRHESDSFFDFDCELESPGSPADECEYLRLIETASNTPHNSAAESGYVCASAASSQGSSEAPYFGVLHDEDTIDAQQQTPTSLHSAEFPDYVKSVKTNGSVDRLHNGYEEHIELEHDNEQTTFAKKDVDSPTAEKSPCVPTFAKKDVDSPTAEKPPCVPTKSPAITTPSNLSPTDKWSQHDELETNDNKFPCKEMADIQHDIIAELQDHSDRVSESIDSQPANENNNGENASTDSKPTTPPDVASEPENIAPQLKLDVSNGNCADEEEALTIELTEATSIEDREEQKVQTKDISEKPAPTETADDSTAATADDSTAATADDTQANEVSSAKSQNKSIVSGLHTTDDDEDDCRPQRIRRCSSLKTGKTPPGTPGRKKIVRFADVLGLDLADVKTFLDEIPNVPKSAYEDLEIMELEPPIQLGPKANKLLMPLFQQPGGLPTFLDLVRVKLVSLENAAVTDHITQTITGTVRVRNLDFHKSVHIRYSLDNWRSFADLQANYAENSCDGFSDTFSFVLFGNTLHIGQRLEFAVRFQCKGQQFWDNNYGTNYCFQCLPASSPATNSIAPILPSHHRSHITIGMLSPSVGDAWCTSFY